MRVHASLDLFFRRCTVMLNVSILEITIEALQIEERRDVWVGHGAMVALIEVVRQDLPIVVAYEQGKSTFWSMIRKLGIFTIKFVSMIELIITEVNARLNVSLLDIHILKVLLEWHFRHLLRIHVHLNESIAVNAGMNQEKTVLVLLKIELLIARRFCELAIQAI